MLRKALFFTAFFLLIISCSKREGSDPKKYPDTILGKWMLVGHSCGSDGEDCAGNRDFNSKTFRRDGVMVDFSRGDPANGIEDVTATFKYSFEGRNLVLRGEKGFTKTYKIEFINGPQMLLSHEYNKRTYYLKYEKL